MLLRGCFTKIYLLLFYSFIIAFTFLYILHIAFWQLLLNNVVDDVHMQYCDSWILVLCVHDRRVGSCWVSGRIISWRSSPTEFTVSHLPCGMLRNIDTLMVHDTIRYVMMWCVIFIFFLVRLFVLPLVLWHFWLGGRKGIRPVKIKSGEMLAWLSVWSEVQTCICPMCSSEVIFAVLCYDCIVIKILCKWNIKEHYCNCWALQCSVAVLTLL